MLDTKICALFECNRPVLNWRMSCCCKTHQKIHAGRKSHNTHNQAPMSIKERKSHWSNYIVNRRKKRDKSMPAWADKNKIEEFYLEARRLTEETGIKHEVDHIIPSNHPLVCGLHNEFNLQILTKKENQLKSNRF